MAGIRHAKQQPVVEKANVRPEIAALSRRIVAEDREALDILAAYDRGEMPTAADQKRQAVPSAPMQPLTAPIKQ